MEKQIPACKTGSCGILGDGNGICLSMLALSVTVKEMVPFRVTEEARKLARAWAAMGVVLLSS